VFDSQLAQNDEDNMAFVTPVVSDIVWTVNDKTKLDISKLARANRRGTRRTRMHRFRDLRPIRHTKRQAVEMHAAQYIVQFKVTHYHRARRSERNETALWLCGKIAARFRLSTAQARERLCAKRISRYNSMIP
jgi:hypothetical protein